MLKLPGLRRSGITLAQAAGVLILLLSASAGGQANAQQIARPQTARAASQQPLPQQPRVADAPQVFTFPVEPATAAVIVTDQRPRVPAAASPAVGRKLDGVWLVDSVEYNGESRISDTWYSQFTIFGDEFTISRFFGNMDEYAGRFKLIHGKSSSSGAIDLQVPKFEFSFWFPPPDFAAGTLRGLYKITPNAVTLCVAMGPHQPRPTEFVSSERAFLITLKRAAPGFTDFPKQVAVSVIDPAGKPVAGARVFRFLQIMRLEEFGDRKLDWEYHQHGTTDANGVLQVPYDSLQHSPLSAHVPKRKLIGTQRVSPASLQKPGVKITLERECRVHGTIIAPELTSLHKEIGQTYTGLSRHGQTFASIRDQPGQFEFFAPAGQYMLGVGGDNVWSKRVPLTVPASGVDVEVPPIEVKARNHALLAGTPAPEFVGVLGWYGKPFKLADLRGKVVLVHFWNLRSPFVNLPHIQDLYEEFHDQGLELVGVHIDDNGSLVTPAQVKKAVIDHESFGDNRKIRFSMALVSNYGSKFGRGENVQGCVTDQYGISGTPTTMLIDAHGILVGDFSNHGQAAARALLKSLLPKQN